MAQGDRTDEVAVTLRVTCPDACVTALRGLITRSVMATKTKAAGEALTVK